MCPEKKDDSFMLTVPLEKTVWDTAEHIKGIPSFLGLEDLNYNNNKCLDFYLYPNKCSF